MGIGLAACAGLRTFLPLFVVGVAGRLGWLTLAKPFSWLESWPALVTFGVAVVTEILADKIPVVDHILDVLQGFLKPIAGTILVVAVVHDLTPLQATVVGLIAGGSVAGLTHLLKAKIRLLSSSTTAGLGNPVLSVSEDVASAGGSVGAIVSPFLMLGVAASGLAITFVALRKFRRTATRLEG